MAAFNGLNAEAFATYAPEKWSSNVHNLPRMRVKDTMLALCDAAQQGLEQELAGLARAASDEVPNILNQKRVDAQWVYWARDKAARESLASFLEKMKLDQSALLNALPQDKHITMAVVLRQPELWVGTRVAAGASVDRHNLAAKLAKVWERERMLALIQALPPGALLGPEGALVPAGEVTLELLAAYADQLDHGEPPWQVGYSTPAAEAMTLGADLALRVREQLKSVAPIFRFTAWTRDNDHIEVGKQIQEEKAQKRRQAAGHNPGDKVRIISGLFAGKIGIVQEIDTKAQVKVQVGKMSVVVSGSDLTPVN